MSKVRALFTPKVLIMAALGMAVSMLNGQSAQALTQFATVNVTANVVNTCTITAAPVTFDVNYDVTDVNPNVPTTPGSVSVTCTAGAPYFITLSEGQNPGAGSAPATPVRRMTNGTSFLGYSLYLDSGLTTVWNGVSGAGAISGTGNNAAQAYSVYGQIPAQQASISSGAYSDGVTATVNY